MRRSITKKLLVSTLAASVFVTLAGISTFASAATTLRFGHVHVNGELAAELEQEFADRVNQRSKGELVVKVFPAEQLGKEIDLIQQVKSGALDITTPSMAALSNLVPALEIASGPFLWKDWAQAESVIRGPAFQPIFDEAMRQYKLLLLYGHFIFFTNEVERQNELLNCAFVSRTSAACSSTIASVRPSGR